MSYKQILLKFCLINFNINLLVQYELMVDEDLIKACIGKNVGTNYVNPGEYIDLSNMKMETLGNGEQHVSGFIEIIKELPVETVPFSLEFLRKGRGGTYQPTAINLKRPDLCTAIFDPSEVWYDYLVKSIPIEEQKCPLYKGQIFNYNQTWNLIFTMALGNLAGDYVGHYNAKFPNTNIEFCWDVPTEVYRLN